MISISFFAFNTAQGKPFRTGLVLSGGGAKGLAHIGLLHLVDSLEIQVDYITGTSMGSILAGMYSVGYSADSINQIMNEIDWAYVLSDKLPLNRIHINEKDNFSNQLFNLPVKKSLPKIPGFLVEGQYLSEQMGKYFFSARNSNDFHKLPIPLEVISADIVSGKKVILNNGYLPVAIRSSMAIPAVFAPVEIDNQILVDGGVKRNFPVEEIKKMGAEFVIGSYTGFRKMSEEEMDNAINSIYQSFAIDAVEDAKQMMLQTDILLDFSESLKTYGTQSFGEYKSIIEIGRKEAQKLLPQLIELKKRQVDSGIKFNRKKVENKFVPIQNIQTLQMNGEELPADERKNILAVLDTLHINRLDTIETISEKMEELFSHLNYKKIYHTFSANDNNTKNLNLYFKKSQPNLHVSIHYDTYEDAGIVLRYNHTNLFLNNSKFSAAVDLSKYYKSNIYYLKYLNNKKNLWAKVDYNFRRERSNDMFFKAVSQMLYFTNPNIHNSHHTAVLSVAYSPNISSAITAGLEAKYDRFAKEMGGYARSLSLLSDSTRIRPLYKHTNNAVFIRYNYNSLNRNILPTSGHKLEIGSKLHFNNKLQLNEPPNEDKVAMEFYNMLNPINYPDSSSTLNSTLQVWANERAVIPLSKKISLSIQAFAGMNFDIKNNTIQNIKSEEYLPQNQKFNLGGYNDYKFDNQLPFPGLSVNELRVNSLGALTLSMQWNVWKNLYISPKTGFATTLAEIFDTREPYFFSGFMGVGVDIDYMTVIGPIKFSANTSGLKPNFFFSLGYQF